MGMCFVFSIEFQKRGAPHVHLVIWLNRPLSVADYDQIMCAELPNPETQPRLYKLDTENHLHGDKAILLERVFTFLWRTSSVGDACCFGIMRCVRGIIKREVF